MELGLAADILNSQTVSGQSHNVSGIALRGKKAMDPAQADKAAKDFEAVFLSQMLEHMFGDSVGESAFGDKDTSDVYKSMLMQEYGKIITEAGGIGIASHVKNQLLKLQEV